jgi:hypothetical protein
MRQETVTSAFQNRLPSIHFPYSLSDKSRHILLVFKLLLSFSYNIFHRDAAINEANITYAYFFVAVSSTPSNHLVLSDVTLAGQYNFFRHFITIPLYSEDLNEPAQFFPEARKELAREVILAGVHESQVFLGPQKSAIFGGK